MIKNGTETRITRISRIGNLFLFQKFAPSVSSAALSADPKPCLANAKSWTSGSRAIRVVIDIMKHLPRLPPALGLEFSFGLALLLFASGSRLHAKPENEIIRGPRGKSQIALTFDAGASADCFNDLILALEKAHVCSTFFITGNWARQNRECAQAITKHGHEVGNHTLNHFDLTKRSNESVREELTQAEVLLTEISGHSPFPNFRAPFGARNERVLQIAASLGYRSIYWTMDSLDSIEPPKSPRFLTDRITAKSDTELDGAIILMHVGEKSTADALPAIIANLQSRHFRLVTVSELLR